MDKLTEETTRFKTWTFGTVKVTRIPEMSVTLDPTWLLKATKGDVIKHKWLQPDFATADGDLFINVQAFIIETDGKRIMVDPCVGNSKPRSGALFNMLNNPFLERLTAAGFPRESIDVVLCTHLHTDHCGWNTMLVEGKWLPTFPNARYLFAQIEFDHARNEKEGESEATYNDSILPIIEAGLADFIDPSHIISDEVRLEPTPGHTPGHCCIVINSMGHEALITGDLLHHPLQAAAPLVCSNFCWNEEQAVASRKSILTRAAQSGMVLLGTHFAEPTSVRVVPEGQTWRMETA